MSVQITYFVHGTTTDNEAGLATGWLPGELSTLGLQQSKDLRSQVSHLSFDVVFCSDLKRAVDTAELAFGGQYQIIEDERLRECNYGDKNGGPHDFKKNMDDFVDSPFPSGESYHDVEKRMADFADMLRAEWDGKHVAIVAHQGPQLALDVLLKNMSWSDAIKNDWRKTKSWQPGWGYDA